MKNLEYLSFVGNEIPKLPFKITKLTKLERIRCDKNYNNIYYDLQKVNGINYPYTTTFWLEQSWSIPENYYTKKLIFRLLFLLKSKIIKINFKIISKIIKY